MESLRIGDTEITYEEIRSGNYSFSSSYFNHTLDFCKSWLNGTESFEVPTSGSTGEPRITVLRRSDMIFSARATGKALELEEGDKALVCINTKNIGGMMMLVRGFELGLRLEITEPSSDPFLVSSLPDFTSLVPYQLSTVMNRDPNVIAAIPLILVGGASISYSLEDQCRRLGNRIFHTYGMTETCSHIALRQIGFEKYFKPMDGYIVSLNDRSCLCIKGPVTGDTWLETNDIAEIHENNSFLVLGRIDDIINSGGVKISLKEVEESADKFNGLDKRQFFAGALDDKLLGQKLVLVVEGDTFDPHMLTEFIKSDIGKFRTPKEVFFLDKFLLTASGKIDKNANLKLIKEQSL